MKAKIFAKLKQEYSALGLGDEILMSRAESLAATGLVNDENLEFVVAAQKQDLQAMQKLNDKRVNDALDKERKKHAEEKAEREKAEKEAAEAKAKAEEEAKAKLEAEKKAKEDAEAKAKEEAEKKAEEEAKAAELKKLEESKQIPTDLIALLKKEREASEARIKAYEAKMQELLEKTEQREKASSDTFANLQKSYQELADANTALKANYDALKTESEQVKLEKAKAARENFILSKAKELGVPQWRVDEGFVIAEDADETAITETIQKVANNIKTQQLPVNHSNFPLNDNKPTANDVADLAKLIVK